MSETNKNNTASEAVAPPELTVVNTDTKKKQSPLLIKLSKPYSYEGKTYTELDLTKIDELTASDLFTASKVFATEGYISSKPETDPKFCCMVAALAAGLPKEFFNKLPIKDGNHVKEVVFDFFQDED